MTKISRIWHRLLFKCYSKVASLGLEGMEDNLDGLFQDELG